MKGTTLKYFKPTYIFSNEELVHSNSETVSKSQVDYLFNVKKRKEH